MPLTEPKSASMAFMDVLLARYPDRFAWFSLRGQAEPEWNPYALPYAACPSPNRPARFPRLRLLLAYFLWPLFQALKASRFARQQGCDLIFADLAFESVLAGRLAARFAKLPLFVNIHDDPPNRLRLKNHPAWFLRWYESQFARTLRAAQSVGVISDAMGEVYRERYGVRSTTLYIGVEPEKCLEPLLPDPQKQPILIASLGSVNSTENWNLLIAAVKKLNLEHGPGKFRVLHIGNLNPTLPAPSEVEVTGWLPQEEFLKQLERVDLCFLNWSFAPELAETGRLSFPLKIHSFLQSQRPFLTLAPQDSSVARFTRDHALGLVCDQPEENELAAAILRLLTEVDLSTKALEGLRITAREFSRERFFDTFEAFLKVDGPIS